MIDLIHNVISVQKKYVDNKDRLASKQKSYGTENRDKINTRMNEYLKNRLKNRFQLSIDS